MKRKLLLILAVLVLSLMIVGNVTARNGWEVNQEVWPISGGLYNVIKEGKAILWKGATIFPGGSATDCDPCYWQADENASCPPSYPEASIGMIGYDLTPWLGWNDPDWYDEFIICFPSVD